MLFKNEYTYLLNMYTLATCQTPVVICTNRRRRTYRQWKQFMKEPCIKNADALDCAIRHRRCKGCPFNDFFKPEPK
jgi:hypothetical protein